MAPLKDVNVAAKRDFRNRPVSVVSEGWSEEAKILHTAVKRVIFYVVLAATCYGIAIFFGESTTVFVVVFSTGLLIALSADLMFLRHIYRVFSNRQRQ